MSIKLCLLKSGEKVIANVEDMISPQTNNMIGYYFDRPFLVMVAKQHPEKISENEIEAKVGITPWIPLTRDKIIPVPLDWVITMVDPIESVLNIYQKGVLGQNDKHNSVDEQQNIDQSS